MAVGLCGEQLCDMEGCLEVSEYRGPTEMSQLEVGGRCSLQHKAILTTGKGLNLMTLKTGSLGHKGLVRMKAEGRVLNCA